MAGIPEPTHTDDTLPKMDYWELCVVFRGHARKFSDSFGQLPKGTYKQMDFMAVPRRYREKTMRVSQRAGFDKEPDFVAGCSHEGRGAYIAGWRK